MTDLAGRTLGRYRLETLLGRGGMADVWRATDTKLARTVAVKVIHASFAQDAQFAERFLREARVVASLEHPNILPVYDFGEEDGIPFLVMPYLAGGTLRDRLRGAPAPFALGAAWIRQLADALDAAHAAGVLHRDVKPANVLLGRDDRLFLADFGIAKMVETLTGLTATGVVVGTPVYMAPEQAQGQPASPATDRYALAVVAYEILSGRPPFDGDNPLSLMHQHVTTPAPALSSRVGGLPAGLDAVLSQALSKDPARRPATCRALADAIGAFLPTGFLPAAAPGPGVPSSATAPTILQPRGGTPPPAATPSPQRTAQTPRTPPPVSVATPPPSLTSDATVLTAGRQKRRALLWAATAVAAGIAVFGFRLKVKRPTAPVATAVSAAPTAVPTAAPPASTAAASTSVAPSSHSRRNPFLGLLEHSRRSCARRRRKAHRGPREAREGRRGRGARGPRGREGRRRESGRPSRDSAAAAGGERRTARTRGENAAPHAALVAARERLDVLRKPDRRLSKDDFQFALDTARRVTVEHPKNPDARYVATYAEGGLAYVAGNDALAGALAVESVLALKRAGKQDHRALQQLLTQPDGSVVAPRGWELAVAYGDARGEAMALLDAAVRENPRDVRAQRARAMLRRLHGLEPDGPEPRRATRRSP